MNVGHFTNRKQVRKYPQKPREKNTLPSISIEKIPQTKLITLSRYINDYERSKVDASFQFGQLMSAIQTITKTVSGTLRSSGLGQRHIFAKNIGTMDPEELGDLFVSLAAKLLEKSNSTSLILLKNVPDVIKVDKQHCGKYIIAFSVLDNELSSDATSCTGSLFTIFKRNENVREASVEEILQPGRNSFCAGYIVYGSATVMVLSLRNEVNIFTLDPILGEFILVEEGWTIPKSGYVYSVNEGYSYAWDHRVVKFLDYIRNPLNQKPWMARFTGSLVSDAHRILQGGGIYLYPSNLYHPNGKVSLLYEAIPLAKIAAHSGGLAISNTDDILHIVPKTAHQKTAFYFGSVEQVSMLKNVFLQSKENEHLEELYPTKHNYIPFD